MGGIAALDTQILTWDQYAFSFYSLPPLLTSLAILLLGLFVFLKEWNSKVSFSFFFFSCLVAVWLFCFSWMYSAKTEPAAFFWAKSAYGAVPFIPFAIYLFTAQILNLTVRHKNWLILSGLISLIFVVLISQSNAFVQGIYQYSWGYYPKYGWLSIPFILYFAILGTYNLYLYARAIRDADSPIAKKRAKFLLVCFSIAYLASVDYLAKFGIPIYPFGFVPLLVFLILAAKAVSQYRFTDITEAERMVREVSRSTRTWTSFTLLMIFSIAGLSFYTFRVASMSIQNLAVTDDQTATTAVFWLGVHIAMAAFVIIMTALIFLVVLSKVSERHRRLTQLLASVVQFSDDAIITKTLDGVIVSWNKGAEEMYGYKANEVLNKNVSILIPSEEKESLSDILESLKKGMNLVHYEAVRRKKNGTLFNVTLTISPIRDASGKITGAVAIAKDVTQKKKFEQELIEKNKELERTTLELKERTNKLQRFHNLTIDREIEMKRLKAEVDELREKLGVDKKYEVRREAAL